MEITQVSVEFVPIIVNFRRMRKYYICPALILIYLSILSCNFPFKSLAQNQFFLSSNTEGNQKTTSYPVDQPFFAIAELPEAPQNTNVRAIWSIVTAEGFESGSVIGESEIISGRGIIHFELRNDNPWPVGKYKVDLYINGILQESLEYDVK